MSKLRGTPGITHDTPCGWLTVPPSGIVEVENKWVEPLVAIGFEVVEIVDEDPTPEQLSEVVETKPLAGKKTKRVYTRTEDEDENVI